MKQRKHLVSQSSPAHLSLASPGLPRPQPPPAHLRGSYSSMAGPSRVPDSLTNPYSSSFHSLRATVPNQLVVACNTLSLLALGMLWSRLRGNCGRADECQSQPEAGKCPLFPRGLPGHRAPAVCRPVPPHRCLDLQRMSALSKGLAELSGSICLGTPFGSTSGQLRGSSKSRHRDRSISSGRGLGDSSRSFIHLQPLPSFKAAVKSSPQRTSLPPPGPSGLPPTSLCPPQSLVLCLLTHAGVTLSASLLVVRLHESRAPTGPPQPQAHVATMLPREGKPELGTGNREARAWG